MLSFGPKLWEINLPILQICTLTAVVHVLEPRASAAHGTFSTCSARGDHLLAQGGPLNGPGRHKVGPPQPRQTPPQAQANLNPAQRRHPAQAPPGAHVQVCNTQPGSVYVTGRAACTAECQPGVTGCAVPDLLNARFHTSRMQPHPCNNAACLYTQSNCRKARPTAAAPA